MDAWAVRFLIPYYSMPGWCDHWDPGLAAWPEQLRRSVVCYTGGYQSAPGGFILTFLGDLLQQTGDQPPGTVRLGRTGHGSR